MSYGALKTLYTMLQGAPSLEGVTLSFGEESVNAEENALPAVAMVPIGGPWLAPQGFLGSDPSLNVIWMARENIDLYLWAASSEPTAQPIDHADAIENLRVRVLQAFQYAQFPGGLRYIPQSGRWQLARNETNRYGRAYVLTIQVEISVPDQEPVNATVTKETFNPSIVEA